jgi:hypothetical protein
MSSLGNHLHLVPVAVVPLRTNPLPEPRQEHRSTRALYGNRDHRPPFPELFSTADPGEQPRPHWARSGGMGSLNSRSLQHLRSTVTDYLHQVWISLRIATDVLPLLVNACSDSCLQALPAQRIRPGPARWRHTPTTSAPETVDAHAQMCLVVRHIGDRGPAGCVARTWTTRTLRPDQGREILTGWFTAMNGARTQKGKPRCQA